MAVLGHNKQINFNVTPLGQDDVVLGIPWLRNHNPVIDWKNKKIEFMNCNCPWMNRLKEWDSGTLLWLTGWTDDYVKQLRGGLKTIRCILCDQDAATNMIIAVMKTLEQYWLRELSGWAPEMTEEYVMNVLIKEISENQMNNKTWGFKDNLDLWQFINWKWITVNSDLEVPEEYKRY